MKHLKSVKLFSAAGLFLFLAIAVSFNTLGNSDDPSVVTLNCSNVTLEETLIEINRQSGYHFRLKNDLLSIARPFDINVKEVSLNYAISICFKNQPLTYIIKKNTIIVKKKSEGDIK